MTIEHALSLTIKTTPINFAAYKYIDEHGKQLKRATRKLEKKLAQTLPKRVLLPNCSSNEDRLPTILAGVSQMELEPLLVAAIQTLPADTLKKHYSRSRLVLIKTENNVCYPCNTPPPPCHIVSGVVTEQCSDSDDSTPASWSTAKGTRFKINVFFRFNGLKDTN